MNASNPSPDPPLPPPPPATVEPGPSADVEPLLPPLLLRAAPFLWLWTLPTFILLLLNLQAYALVQGELSAEQRACAFLLGLFGLLNPVAGLVCFFTARRHAALDPEGLGARAAWWGLPAIAAQVGYLWFAFYALADGKLLPASVTAWIYPEQRFLYNQFALAMPALAYGMLRLACAGPRGSGKRSLAWSLGLGLGAPLLLYLFFQSLRFLENFAAFGSFVLAVLVVLLGLAMFVGIIRALALLLRDLSRWHPRAEAWAALVLALALPLAGLLLNREIPFPNDFQSAEVYTLTVANAAFLLVAIALRGRRPLLGFALLCATLPFTLYFFFVFLPFLPLSILAVILLGAGFLVLTPTLLLVLHLYLLKRSTRPGWRFAVAGVAAFLLLPGFFTARALADRAALNAALDHVYAPVVSGAPLSYPGSLLNLRRALTQHRAHKDGLYYPLLSDYYSWLVFDNLVLPDEKLDLLERRFFGREKVASARAGGRGSFWGEPRRSVRERNAMPRAARPPRDVLIDSLRVSSAPLDAHDSTLTLGLTLRNTGSVPAEYATRLPLPPGVFVSGFRLQVAGRMVSGRITEKKTALWVYAMIRDTERRDPGLVYHDGPDALELRVFPVPAGEPVAVEIDFIAPLSASAPVSPPPGATDPAAFLRSLAELVEPRSDAGPLGVLVAGGLDRVAGPPAPRPPYLHVLVDRSLDNGFTGDLPAALARLSASFEGAEIRRVTLLNHDIADLPAGTFNPDLLPLGGGLALDAALARALRLHAVEDLDVSSPSLPARPVFVLLGRTDRALADYSLASPLIAAWRDVVPVIEFHTADTLGNLATPREPLLPGSTATPLFRLGDAVRPLLPDHPLRFPSVPGPSRLETWSPAAGGWVPVSANPAATAWSRAARLHLEAQDHARSPGAKPPGEALRALLATSRETGVLIPVTSYIVVENSAQWRMLDLAERQKLDQNAALDFRETPAPSWLLLSAGFAAWLALRRRRIAA